MRCLITLFLSILILVSTYAQEEYINFDVWEADLTKVGSQVLDLYQDDDGYIWLSTFNGVIRFDGSQFTHIADIYPESDQLPTSHISCVRKDKKGNIWIGTIEYGLYLIDNEGHFYDFNNLTADTDTLNEYRIEDILHTDSMLFITGRTGLTTYRIDNDKYHKVNDILNQSDRNIKSMLSYNNDILFATQTSITSLNGTINDHNEVRSPQIFLDMNGYIYGSSYAVKGSTLYKYIDEKWQILAQQPFKFVAGYHTFKWDRSGRIWAFRYNNDLVCYDYKNGKWVIEKEAINHNLGQRRIRDVLVDNSGTVWIGAEVVSLNRKREGIRSIKISLDGRDDIRNLIFHNDELYYATSFDGLHKVDKNGNHSKITTTNSKIASLKFLNLDVLDKTTIGILHSRGFQSLTNEGQFSDVTIAKGSNRSMCQMGGYYWIGGVSKILRIDPVTREVKKYPFRSYNKSQNIYINGMAIKSESEIYIGSNLKELHVFDINKETFTPVTSTPEIAIHPSSCNHISISNNNILVIATERGLYTYDGYKYEVLIPREYFMSVEWANDSLIIASTKDKIYKINIHSKNQSIIYQDNGLLNSRFTQRSVAKTGTEICFGGNHGLDCINAVTPLDSLSTVLNLESIIVNNQEIKSAAGEEIILPQNARHIALKLNQIYTKSQNQAKILYKNNDESEWQILANNTLILDNPRPGTHTFEFKSSIPNYAGKNKSLTVDFEIPIPWYKQPWFWLLGIVAFISGIAWLVIRDQNKRRQKQLEEVQLKADVAELRLQSLSGQMNPHFTFNALNSILQMINEHDTEGAAIYVQKFSRMMRFVLEYSDQSWVTIEKESKFLEDYLLLEKMRFNDSFEYSIDVENPLEAGHLLIPPFFIQPNIENALKHGIRELEKGGKIDVQLQLQNKNIVVTITDNGIGIEASKSKNKLHNTNTNKGIDLTQRRLNQLSKLGYETEMNIETIYNNGSVIGTQVTIKLPSKSENKSI